MAKDWAEPSKASLRPWLSRRLQNAADESFTRKTWCHPPCSGSRSKPRRHRRIPWLGPQHPRGLVVTIRMTMNPTWSRVVTPSRVQITRPNLPSQTCWRILPKLLCARLVKLSKECCFFRCTCGKWWESEANCRLIHQVSIHLCGMTCCVC